MSVVKIDRWSHRTLRTWILLSLVLTLHTNAGIGRNRAEYNAKKLKSIVNELKKQLGITDEIQTVVVPKNNLVVSVQPVKGQPRTFQISFEEGFLNLLDDNDMRAVVAHELGHVWIFTHHPYLHTEDLANSIAYKAVGQKALDLVYEKVRSRPGAKDSLAASMH
jgi:hypothetical protein